MEVSCPNIALKSFQNTYTLSIIQSESYIQLKCQRHLEHVNIYMDVHPYVLYI